MLALLDSTRYGFAAIAAMIRVDNMMEILDSWRFQVLVQGDDSFCHEFLLNSGLLLWLHNPALGMSQE